MAEEEINPRRSVLTAPREVNEGQGVPQDPKWPDVILSRETEPPEPPDRVYVVRMLGCRLPTERVASLRPGALGRFMRRQIRPLGYWHPVLSAPRCFPDYDPSTGRYCTYVYADYGIAEEICLYALEQASA